LNNPNLSNPLATPATTSNYTLTVTDVNGCVSAPSAPVTVTVFTQPAAPTITASGPTTFCQGGEVTLSASGGVTYLWSNGASGSSITVNTSGSYTVVLTDANGCSSPASAAVVVNVTPGPPVPSITANGPLVFCQGGNVQLTSSASNSYEWSTGETGVSMIATTSGVYSVTIADALGCESTSLPITVTVNPLPTQPVITAQSAAAFCPGGSTVLQAPAASSWLWSNGAVTQTISVNTTGVFSVTLTDANGCSSPVSANFATTLYPAPTAPIITATGKTTFCQGESVTLSVPTAQSYLWSNGQTTQAITVNVSGVFSVETVNLNGCQAPTSAPVPVTMNPRPTAPVISAAQTLSFCDGQTVVLNANPTTGITWSTGANTASIEVGATGAYTATYTDPNGCLSFASNSLVVTVIPLANTPVITANGPTDVCQGDSVTLSSSAAASYLWSNGSTSNSITVTSSGVYSVTTGSQCPAANMTDNVTVQVRPIPVPAISADVVKDCLPSIINFGSSTNGIGPFIYSWSFGDGDYASSSFPAHEYVEAGNYTITLTITDVIGCSGSQSIPNYIEILPRANLQFSIDPPVTTLSDPLVTFSGLTSNAYNETWEIEGFGIFNDDQVQILFEDTGAYVVTYSAVTSEGCEASKRDTVFVFDEFALYVPGAFSPNEDGLNDIFVPVASGFEVEDFEFQVFNRWGQRIFSTNQIDAGWDGSDAKQDVYIWTITGRSRINKETVEYKGSVTLIH
jgi:gliding motility-associated-like protein